MYVTHELRAKIKALKRELTYDKFLQNLIKEKNADLPKSAKSKTNPVAKQGVIS